MKFLNRKVKRSGYYAGRFFVEKMEATGQENKTHSDNGIFWTDSFSNRNGKKD
jgi:hypothetical protein